MKLKFITILCFSYSMAIAQSYELNYRDWDTASPYEYWLTLNYSEEPNIVTLTDSLEQDGYLTIEGTISDYRDSALQTLIWRLDPRDSSQMEPYVPDESGYFKLNFDPGTILLQFTLQGSFKTQYLLISANVAKKISYELKLGRSQPFEQYLIHSKRILTVDEIESTVDCIKENFLFNQNETWNCAEGKDFYIGISGG
ncbi:hypothetical protein [Owenweeksia hongkongensis]|uniref:hypothetical protein n=1 Tax=Owenweeksia hongkongensis TaxID=253245 RepID=UPI003A90D44C